MTDEKTQRLKNLLDKMSIIDQKIDKEEIKKEFCEIYKNQERHEYSKIYGVLIKIDKEISGKDLNTLSDNIYQIIECLHDKADIEKSVYKLYNHINLELARIDYMKVIDEKTDKTKNELKNKITELLFDSEHLKESFENQNKSLKEQINKTEELENNLKDYNKEVFGIMGIFLSIFSIIGINFDVYKMISNLPLSKVILLFITVNISLLLLFNFMFCFIKDNLIREREKTENTNGFWLALSILIVMGVVSVVNINRIPEDKVRKINELEQEVKELKNKLK